MALLVALTGALLATAGDFLMLLAANPSRPHPGFSSAPAFALPVGGSLGVLAIPLYAIGYWGIARVLGQVSTRRARVVLIAGGIVSLLGAFIHGWTAVTIHDQLASRETSALTFAEMLATGGVLSIAWATAAGLTVAASLAIASPRTYSVLGLPAWLTLVSPTVLTVVLAAAAMPSETGRAFWVPAAPNLAHILCFGLWLLAIRE